METLKNYLDNMFAAFPQSEEIVKLKADLSNGMEDKYNELKDSGKNENEAIAIVISEFGNIEELINELNISKTPALPTDRIVTMEDAQTILADKKKYGGHIAFGVWLCIMGTAAFLLLGGIISSKVNMLSANGLLTEKEDFLYALCFIPLFLSIAIAVAIFIYSGSQLEKHETLLKSKFILDYGVENFLKTAKVNFAPKNTLRIVIGVIICIFAVLTFLLLGTLSSASVHEDLFGGMALFLLLFMVSVAIVIFICAGNVMETYNALLREEEYSTVYKKDNKIVLVAAAVVWPTAAAIYLIWSFLTGDWHISWLIWPVTGILFGAFTAVCNIITEK